MTLGERAADKLTKIIRSWTFLITYNITIASWQIINVWLGVHAPDPYPFILLNLALSWLAGVQAPIIMMSQHRAALAAEATDKAFREKWEEDRIERRTDRKYMRDSLAAQTYMIKELPDLIADKVYERVCSHHQSQSDSKTNNSTAPPD